MQPFVPPCLPVLQKEPPDGPLWIHEVKFDGYRVQIHKDGNETIVYSRRGSDFTKRAGRGIVEAVRRLPCQDCILDGELVAFGDGGGQHFEALHLRRSKSLAVVVFDILHLDGVETRSRPLSERRAVLRDFVKGPSALVVAETFDDPIALLAACEEHGLEGIVSKRIDKPYRSGSRPEWVKVKTEAWKTASRSRGKMFEPRRK